MPYFHVSITTKSGNHRPEVELDVGSDELESRFLEPYRLGGPIVVAGKSVNASDLERIQIFETPYDSNGVNAEILAKGRAGNVVRPVDTHGRLDAVILFQHGDDVTRNYIKGPPGYAARTQSEPTKEVRPATNAREVFVVHGRNDTAREAMFEFLRALDLHPLEWSESVTDTGKASPYIGEILDVAFSRAHAIVVLFTPDDEARLKEPFRAENDPPYEIQLTGQARPNVLFEAGMAMARSQDRTILVELGNLRPYSDIGGRHTIRLDNSSQRRQELAQRLQIAGCPAKLTGTDWHKAGDFEAALALSVQEPSEPIGVDNEPLNIAEQIHLLEEARELLIEAAKDRYRLIVVTRTMGGLAMRTNGKGFGERGNPRSEAKWLAAIEELRTHQFVESYKGKGEAYEVTYKGFQIADVLVKK